MIRITTIFLCILLAAAAAGRYRAEESVRKARDDLQRLEFRKVEELSAVKMLRAEIAYLEGPARLAKIAEIRTDLRPSNRDQLLTARQFAASFGDEEIDAQSLPGQRQNDTITNAVAMALNSKIE